MTSLMQQEIFSEPEMLKRTVAACAPVLPAIKKAFQEKGITNIVTMARGTSDNAATVFSFVCPLYSGMKVGKYHPSLTTVYDADVDMKNTCMVIVSQSGMSKDTIAVMRKAKKLGAMTVGVTNNKESDTAKECDFHLFLDVEEEKSVAATKTYIAELIALYMLTTVTGKPCDTKVNETVARIGEIIALNEDIKSVAEKLYKLNNFIILSRGTMQGTGDECALKLTECCYMFNRAFSTANFMHGPFSLIDETANVILLAPSGVFEEEYKNLAARIKSLGGKLTVFSDIPQVLEVADNKVVMPKASDVTAPVVYGVAVSLLALNVGLAKGLKVDTPRNLNKVTVTL